jgi:hypothetical protein
MSMELCLSANARKHGGNANEGSIAGAQSAKQCMLFQDKKCEQTDMPAWTDVSI